MLKLNSVFRVTILGAIVLMAFGAEATGLVVKELGIGLIDE